MKSLLIDGSNLIHRTYWTASNIAKDDEHKLNSFHIYFTLNAVKSYVDMFKPNQIFVCWDEKVDYQINERKIIYSDYKGNRSGDTTPHKNNTVIKEFFNHLGIPSLFPQRLEADDCVAFLCDKLEGTKTIVSVDKDFLQLVRTDVSVYSPITKVHCNLANFKEIANCEHEHFLVLKCLQGDKSDNVPGIPKFGKVKQQKFLDNQISLTVEQTAIYNRNLELFRLTKYKEYQDEMSYFETQLAAAYSIEANYNSFINLCERYNMNNILSKKNDWYNLFFMKNKLVSLFK